MSYRLLPLHRIHPRVPHYRLRRLPPHAGRVVADMNSLEFTYCEGRLFGQDLGTSSRANLPNRPSLLTYYCLQLQQLALLLLTFS